MAFVKFMRNKFFHPHTYENQKRTWIAEQKHESEKKRQEELHKQYIKEQSIYENKNLLKHGKLTQDDKLTFMYEPPLQCRKKDDKLELKEVRFEWQKNAPRAGDYAKTLDVADCPFGIEVRNTKCIKCGVWGHMNTDKICPLYNRGLNTEDNPPDLGKEDPMSLLNSMEKGGLRMRKHAVNAVMDVHDNKYRMLEDKDIDPEVAFIANLTDRQKRKLMKKLNRTNSGGSGGGVSKAKHKKDKKDKKKKKKKIKKVDREPAPKENVSKVSMQSLQRHEAASHRVNDSRTHYTPQKTRDRHPVPSDRRQTRRSRSHSPVREIRIRRRPSDNGDRRNRRLSHRSPSAEHEVSRKRRSSPPRSSASGRRDKSPRRQYNQSRKRVPSSSKRHDSSDAESPTRSPKRDRISNGTRRRHDTISSEESHHQMSPRGRDRKDKSDRKGKVSPKRKSIQSSSGKTRKRHDTASSIDSDHDSKTQKKSSRTASDKYSKKDNASRKGKERATKRKKSSSSSSSSSDSDSN